MALYNNGYPATYQNPYLFQPTYQQPQNTGLIWVQGESGAKSYLVAPNNTVQLWDSESQTIYIKSADASGMPSMKVLDYTIRENASNVHPAASVTSADKSSTYATKDEIDGIMAQIKTLRADVDKIKEADHE